MGNPPGLWTVYHAAAEKSPDSTSVITGVNVEVDGVDPSMGLSEDLGMEGLLSIFSNIRDRLLGVREGPVVDGRASVEETPGGTDSCSDKLEND